MKSCGWHSFVNCVGGLETFPSYLSESLASDVVLWRPLTLYVVRKQLMASPNHGRSWLWSNVIFVCVECCNEGLGWEDLFSKDSHIL